VKNKIVNIMGLVGSIAIFLVLASSLVKSLKRIQIGDSVIEKTKVKISKVEEENKRLEDQLNVVKSEEYSEKQLRDKLGLAKEGEIILVLPEADIVRKLSPQIPEEEEVKPKPNWQKWLDLFM
jgi:cell division protein FtsB